MRRGVRRSEHSDVPGRGDVRVLPEGNRLRGVRGCAEGEEEVDSHDGEEAEGLEEIPLEKEEDVVLP